MSKKINKITRANQIGDRSRQSGITTHFYANRITVGENMCTTQPNSVTYHVLRTHLYYSVGQNVK